MKIDRKNLLLCVFAMALLMLGGCSENSTEPEISPYNSNKNMPVNIVYEDGLTRYDGAIGGTNLFAFLVPDNWNGELVVYAHGFIDAAEPLGLPVKDNVIAIRDRVVEMGFAWAYCSYRENGLAIKDGTWATSRLSDLFYAHVKTRPTYTWLMAHSLGGLIGVELVERQPHKYDGLLTMSGMVGGSKVQLDYVGHVRVIFDLLYPGVLPGTVIDVPVDLDLMNDVIYPVMAAVMGDPNGVGIMSMLKQTPLPGRNGDELVESLITALGFNVRAIHDILERTNGACPIENEETVYDTVAPGMLSPEILGMINAAVQRYGRTIPTENLFERNYEPTGNLTIPMIALHDHYDPVVPLFHGMSYVEKVAATGNSHHLDLRVVERYGHTDFSAEEAAEALLDLRETAMNGMDVASNF